MFIGYMRVSINDGSQSIDLQKYALIQFGIDSERVYQDFNTGVQDNQPSLINCLKAV